MPIVFNEASIYTVRPGDTVYSIAQRLQSNVDAILRVNHLYPPVTDPGLIYPGNVLIVPRQRNINLVTYIVKMNDTIWDIAYRFSTTMDLVAGINNIENPNMIFTGQTLRIPVMIYEIQMGDTLNRIARRFGTTVSSIVRANEGRPAFQPDFIWPGDYLIVPLPTSRNIVVWSPYPATRLVNRQRIVGQARVFEANVLHQVRDANGVVVSNERFTTADIGAPAYGNFSSIVPFDRNPTTRTGELWVYSRSAKDGSIQDLVSVPIFFW
ncbi:LysM peptidoglycan-binding domain-containing protein [Calidifontibacillus erzurumensis]|uniref:LysM peptidoglycan-binding domain-containing protein n=1 Tax=Calidifontibacillus erzurumensis TaxID=2741433 RepID=UPI002E78D475|nr:LysM peptidoglycan-binding domain-containing protein [Calidifontibacillus erzurumensis]